MEALRSQVEIVDVPVEVRAPVRQFLRLASARPTVSGWRSQWHHGRSAVALLERDLRGQVAVKEPDVVLEVQDLGVVGKPFLVFQDLSYTLLLDRFSADSPHFPAVNSRRLEELRRRQDRIYRHAAALLPMSQWLASSLQEYGIEDDRIRVVNPGTNVPVDPDRPIPIRRRCSLRRLLFVGRDFERKSGPQVVAALSRLRNDWDVDVRLTVVGPSEWPMRGEVPDGVTFLGPQPATRIAALMDEHDLFVMPSRFEAFGIAFIEALVRGLPCIGRRDFAMPEIIDERSGGRLVDTDSPNELAEAIVNVLADDSLYEECIKRAPERAVYYSWSRAAREVVEMASDIATQ